MANDLIVSVSGIRGIIGAGLMASQLAVLFLRRLEVPVVMKDIKQEFLDKAFNRAASKMIPNSEMPNTSTPTRPTFK